MNIIAITGLCIVATIIIKIFDRVNKEYGLLIIIGTVSFILLMIISYINPVISEIEKLFALSGVSEKY